MAHNGVVLTRLTGATLAGFLVASMMAAVAAPPGTAQEGQPGPAATSTSAPSPGAPSAADLPAPTITSATATTDGITVAWTWGVQEPVPTDVTSVVVRVEPGGLQITAPAADRTATISGLSPDTDYRVTVASARGSSEGASSEPFAATTLAEADTGSSVVDAASSLPRATPGDVTSLIVTLVSESAPTAQAQSATDDLPVAGVVVDETQDLGAGNVRVDLNEGVSESDAALMIADIEADPRVESAMVDERVFRTAFPADPPNDPYWTNDSLWGLYGTYGVGVASGRSTMTSVWSAGQGSGVVVAVLDTGSTVHPDLNANYVAGYDFVSNGFGSCRTGVSNGDGDYIDTATYGALGWDSNPLDPGDWTTVYSSGCGWAGDSSWHGTHVAGTIAAVGNNSVGVIGVAPQAQIQPVRVLSYDGGYTSDIVAAITWASGGTVSGVPSNPTPAKVINLSLGGASSCSATWQNAINGAVANGSTVVVSAGNSNTDASGFVPASCNNVITVASTTSAGERSSFSNYGSTVEVAAPGSGIWSTMNAGATTPGAATYASYNGTSMAAPHVAGVAALIRSLDSSKTPAQVLAAIQSSVQAFPATGSSTQCTTSLCGAGLLTASAAVSGAPIITGVSPSGGSRLGGNSVTISGNNLASPTSVTFNGTAATVTASSATSITVTTPAGTAGSATIVVTTSAGSATATGRFTYYSAPTVTTLSPASGTTAGGTSVTLTGVELGSATSVTFGGTAATITSASSTSVIVTTPARAAGAVDVVVTTLGGSTTVASGFTYLALPVLTTISPTTGTASGGDTVTITGSNLSTTSGVTIGGASAAIVNRSATSLTVTTPARASGLASIVVTNSAGSTTSANAFRYFDPPVATSLSDSSGSTAGGQYLWISGTNLAPNDIQDTSWISVSFGGAAAMVWWPGTTSIYVSTPAHAAGVVDVVVTTPGGSSTLVGAYTYSAPPPSGGGGGGGGGGGSSSSSGSDSGAGGSLQEITEVRPAFGPVSGGNVVAVIGYGFTGATSVTIGSRAAAFRVINDATVEVTIPAAAAPGSADVAINLTAARGRAFAPGGYVYRADSAPSATVPAIPGATPPPSAQSTDEAGDFVTFRANSAELSPATKAKLRRLAASMEGTAAAGTVMTFSDARGTARSTALAKERAGNIERFLASSGVTADLTAQIVEGTTAELRKGAIVRLTSESSASTAGDRDRVSSLIVRYTRGTSPTVKGAVRGANLVTGDLGSGMTLGPNLGLRMYRVDFATPVTRAEAERAADQMMRDPGIEFAEPDSVVSAGVSRG